MEIDQYYKPSASCFSQLEPTRKEGRRRVKPAGNKDTTRRAETAGNCLEQKMVSERMIDMHRKVHMWKAFGELSSTKRRPSVALRSNLARGGKVMQKSIMNTRLQPPACRFSVTTGMVLPNILKRPMPQPRPFSNPATMKKLLYHSSTAFRNPSGTGSQSKSNLMCPSSTLCTIQEGPETLTHTSVYAAGYRYPVPGSSKRLGEVGRFN